MFVMCSVFICIHAHPLRRLLFRYLRPANDTLRKASSTTNKHTIPRRLLSFGWIVATANNYFNVFSAFVQTTRQTCICFSMDHESHITECALELAMGIVFGYPMRMQQYVSLPQYFITISIAANLTSAVHVRDAP